MIAVKKKKHELTCSFFLLERPNVFLRNQVFDEDFHFVPSSGSWSGDCCPFLPRGIVEIPFHRSFPPVLCISVFYAAKLLHCIKHTYMFSSNSFPPTHFFQLLPKISFPFKPFPTPSKETRTKQKHSLSYLYLFLSFPSVSFENDYKGELRIKE